MENIVFNRLTDRLTDYWNRLRKEEIMPDFARFNKEAIDDVWKQCCSLAAERDGTFLYLSVGETLSTAVGENMEGQIVKPIQKQFRAAALIRQAPQIIESKQPLYDRGRFVNDNHKVVKYRSCLLPFGNDVHGVTHLVAGISWREF